MFQHPAGIGGQPVVLGKALDEMLFVGPQATADEADALFGMPGQGRLGQRRQQGIGDGLTVVQKSVHLGGVVLDLLEQHRREVDHGPGLRHRLQVRSGWCMCQ